MIFLILLMSPEPWAQEAGGGKSKLDLNQRYLFLATSRTSTMQKELNEAAAAGYRVFVGCATRAGELALLLEKVAQQPETYDYLLLATTRTSTMQKELNQAASKGFRLLPRATMGRREIVVVLEKAPGAASRYQYLLLATKLTGTLQREMRQASQQGYEVVGLVSRDEHMAILEKPVDGGGDSPSGPKGDSKLDLRQHYLLLATERTSTMQKELDKAAADGYRILASSPTSETEIAMLLEKPGQGSQIHQYKLLATHRPSTMQKEISEAAANGLRVLRQAVVGKRATGGGWRGKLLPMPEIVSDELIIVMEKIPGAPGRYQYLLLDSERTIQKDINQAVAEGYEVVAMASPTKPREWPAGLPVMPNLVVLLEKALTQ